jgi:hypothetical protein
MSALSSSQPTPCRRTEERTPIVRSSTVRNVDAAPYDVTIENLSRKGFSFTSDTVVAVGGRIKVGLAGAGSAGARVAWRKGNCHGCLFRPALTKAQFDAAFNPTSNVLTITPASASAGDAAFGPRSRREHGTKIASPAVGLVLMGLAGAMCWTIIATIL